MEQELDLTKILKGHEGCELYSPICGTAIFKAMYEDEESPILCESKVNKGKYATFSKKGKIYEVFEDAECVLFPSKEIRDWSKFEDNLLNDRISKIKTYEDACKEIGVEPINEECLLKWGFSKGEIAYRKLKVIAKAWNKICNFVPDIEDDKQEKWFPVFKNDSYTGKPVCIDTDYNVYPSYKKYGIRCYLKNSDIALKFGKQFTDLYNDYLPE